MYPSGSSYLASYVLFNTFTVFDPICLARLDKFTSLITHVVMNDLVRVALVKESPSSTQHLMINSHSHFCRGLCS